jgi:hypothetical protein
MAEVGNHGQICHSPAYGLLTSREGKKHDLGDKVDALQTFEQGRSADIAG